MNILLVCTGNTCRSPMAEGILKKLLPEHNVSSAGIFTQDGQRASEHAIEAAAQNEIDISAHKARRINDSIIENSDLILCMTNAHKTALGDVKSKCFTIGEYAGVEESVADPFGGSLDDYKACFAQLERLLSIAAEKIKNEDNTI